MLHQEFIEFYNQLKQNNSAIWFNANKSNYEKHVKVPFQNLINEAIKALSVYEPEFLNQNAKDCIFRINRDIRFSNDKTPYKTHSSAAICIGGKKAVDKPGFYLEISSDKFNIYGGVHSPEKEGLNNIRYYIANYYDDYIKAINYKPFKTMYGSIKGEKNVRLSGNLQEMALKFPEILNKQYYYHTSLNINLITSPDIINVLVESFKNALPVYQFLKKAIDY